MPFLRGRDFTAADRDPAAPVVLVNETFARRVFGNQDPLGRHVRIGGGDPPDPFWRQRLQSRALGLFAALALLLALVGLYGVVAYTEAQRRREIGLRVALGATRRQLVATIVAEGVRLAAAGIAVGLAAALVLTRVLASLLYEVRPTDPLTFVGVPLALAAVALLASWVPALGAAGVEPQRALQSS
ncbi:MAG TPA: FtsX-like permease family protein [Thermoanaerobaculia bacterium]|nr:FtsX-like permease family protein [Thermoanaerobaculia bacterium]